MQRGDRRARDRAARHPARGARADLHRVGGSVAAAAAARRRPRRGQLRRRAREHRQDDRRACCRKSQRMQKDGPSADLLNRAKETARRNYETALKQNRYWLGGCRPNSSSGRIRRCMLHRAERIDARHRARACRTRSASTSRPIAARSSRWCRRRSRCRMSAVSCHMADGPIELADDSRQYRTMMLWRAGRADRHPRRRLFHRQLHDQMVWQLAAFYLLPFRLRPSRRPVIA